MEEMQRSRRSAMPRWRLGLVSTAALLMLAGCADSGDSRLAGAAGGADGVAGGTAPMTEMGDILSGRVAQENRDYAAALGFYRDALRRAPYSLFFLMIRRPPRSTLFPYTTRAED